MRLLVAFTNRVTLSTMEIKAWSTIFAPFFSFWNLLARSLSVMEELGFQADLREKIHGKSGCFL
jgi:hypothetical protein